MNRIGARTCIKIVADGLRKKHGREMIFSELRSLGIPEPFVTDTYLTIESGLKNGVNAAVTEGLSTKGYKRGESELFDTAFDEGFRAFKNQVRIIWIRRFAIGLGIATALVSLVYLLKRSM